MVRIVVGAILIVFYLLGLGGHLPNILSGDPNPMGISRDVYIEATKKSALYGFFLLVAPGLLLIYYGYRARKRKKEQVSEQKKETTQQ